MSDTSEESDSESDLTEYSREEIIHKSLLTVESNTPLGNWEKHTRGIGSKLMAQMGYIVGTGLGKRSDGRVEPVEATVLPAGKSLGTYIVHDYLGIRILCINKISICRSLYGIARKCRWR